MTDAAVGLGGGPLGRMTDPAPASRAEGDRPSRGQSRGAARFPGESPRLATDAASVAAIGWGWRHAGRDEWAIRDLELRIEPGERVLLLGASGSGKSTLLRGLAGVLGDEEDGESAGALSIDGIPAAEAWGRAGLVLQDPEAQVVLARVGDDVAFGCENLGVPRDEIWSRVPRALAAVGLDLPLDHPTSALSGGQKQRLALAGALAMRPGLLLLDEPTAQLDPAGVVEVRDAVLRATEGSTLVVVEHRVAAWAPHVDRVVVLGRGGVIADGSPDRVFVDAADELHAAGVWVPGAAEALGRRIGASLVGPGPLGAARESPSIDIRPTDPTTAPGDPTTGRSAPGATALLEARNLAVARGGAPVAARDIDVRVRAGRALAVVGPNGAGKTTLALTLAGLLPPVSGALEAADRLAGELPTRTRPWRRPRDTRDPAAWTSRELLTRLGMVFQSPDHQLLAPTVRAELEVGPRALGLDDTAIRERVDPLLERLRLAPLAAANPFTLSGGEKRRLTVAAALATRPRVLVLDEPTFGQDARTWQELVALLAELRDAGTALVAVTHDEALVSALADDVLALGEPG